MERLLTGQKQYVSWSFVVWLKFDNWSILLQTSNENSKCNSAGTIGVVQTEAGLDDLKHRTAT